MFVFNDAASFHYKFEQSGRYWNQLLEFFFFCLFGFMRKMETYCNKLNNIHIFTSCCL